MLIIIDGLWTIWSLISKTPIVKKLSNAIPVKFNIQEIFQPLERKVNMQSLKMVWSWHWINFPAFINKYFYANNNIR